MSTKTAQELLLRHPQQRLDSPSRGTSAALHLLGLSSFAYSFWWLEANPNPVNDSYGRHFQHLTILGLTLATLTFVIGLLADMTMSTRLFKVKNILSVTSAPMEVLISILYWGLKGVDESLVLPDWAPRIPFGADFSFHAAPSIALILDLLFFSPPYTVSVLPALGISSGIAVSYWFWVEECYRHNGWYPYPIFDVLGTAGRVGLFAGSAVVMTCSTLCLKWMYNRVNVHAQDVKNKPT
ncbi:hypothetical protein E4T48_04011 [Aureobasidium sp. EXF-10727]|nr:hypothetical protein E4T48_04011 [Aureobasidium sp. EXF-10727]